LSELDIPDRAVFHQLARLRGGAEAPVTRQELQDLLREMTASFNQRFDQLAMSQSQILKSQEKIIHAQSVFGEELFRAKLGKLYGPGHAQSLHIKNASDFVTYLNDAGMLAGHTITSVARKIAKRLLVG